MVIIGLKIQSKLQTLIEQYVDYRTKEEYGISAFWYWYYQVTNYLNGMDKIRLALVAINTTECHVGVWSHIQRLLLVVKC